MTTPATPAATPESPPRIERVRVGRGARSALIVRQAGLSGPQPWVVFIHGWGLAADDYRPWVRHLVRRGNTVVLPRYQVDEQSDPGRSLEATVAGIRAAQRAAPAAPRSVVAAGHSAGAALAADYAAVSKRLGLPRPVAVYAVYPGRAILGYPAGIPPADASMIARDTPVVALAGANDEVVGQAPAQQLIDSATNVRPSRRRYILVRDPAASDHYGPTRRTPAARRAFWRRLDALIDLVRPDR
jgi:pimeloyl-ACP methyl ester carboxylesterase